MLSGDVVRGMTGNLLPCYYTSNADGKYYFNVSGDTSVERYPFPGT
jgi:hypothetical protein